MIMNKTIKRFNIAVVVALLFSVTACSRIQKSLDVIGNGSVASFESVLNTIPSLIEPNEANAGWSLSAPDGAARFIWSGDWNRSSLHDIMLELDASPFIEAGLDPEKLPDDYTYYESGSTGGASDMPASILTIGRKLNGNTAAYNGDDTPLAAYEQIVNLKRDSINYHMALDHYGIALGDGNMFEWAKDIDGNDKDIVFVLNPEPLIAAGVNPEMVEGWVFAKVAVHIDGEAVDADRFLKPFDLK